MGLSPEAAQFYARVYEPARAACTNELRRVGCSADEAENLFMDAYQDVMEKVDPIARNFAPPQMVNYMKRTCRNRLIEDRRHRSVLKQISLKDDSSLLDASAESPDEAAEEREAAAMGREALLSLPAKDRRIFLLRYQLGLSPVEVQAEVPGLTPRSYRRIIQLSNDHVREVYKKIVSGERCTEMERILLRPYVADEGLEEERRLVEAHLEYCRRCRQTHARLRGQASAGGAPLRIRSTAIPLRGFEPRFPD